MIGIFLDLNFLTPPLYQDAINSASSISLTYLQDDVITNQPVRDDSTSIPMNPHFNPSSTPGAATDTPPSYSEAINVNSQGSIKPDETTALNTGDKMGYTPGRASSRSRVGVDLLM